MRIPFIGILILVLLLTFSIVHATETGCADDDDCPSDHICMSISRKQTSYKSCVAKVHKEEIAKRMQEKSDINMNIEKSTNNNQATSTTSKSEPLAIKLMPPIGETQEEEEELVEEKDKEVITLDDEDDDVIDFDDDEDDE